MTSRIVKKPGGLEVWVDDPSVSDNDEGLDGIDRRPGKRLLGLLEEVGRQMDEKGMIGHGQGVSGLDELRRRVDQMDVVFWHLEQRVAKLEETLERMRDRSDEILGNVTEVIVALKDELKHMREEDDDG